MTVRVINGSDMPARRLGSVTESVYTNAELRVVETVQIYSTYPLAGIRMVSIECLMEGGKSYRVNLTESGALEVVKGILQNMPYISIVADDELQGIMKTALADANRHATAIMECLKRATTETK